MPKIIELSITIIKYHCCIIRCISDKKKEKITNSKNKTNVNAIENENSFNNLLQTLDEEEIKIVVQLDVIKRGKRVTNIKGFTDQAKIESIAHELKKTIGTGGTSKNGLIVLQGDHRYKVTEFLVSKGYPRESIEVI